MKKLIGICLQVVAVAALFSLAGLPGDGLAAGETVGQWVWFDKMAVLAAVCLWGALLLCSKGDVLPVSKAVAWSLMLWGAVEAFIGLRQLYGFESSRHSLYALTGSFFNPGPYSGYLAMVLPVCLYRWLGGKEREEMLRLVRNDGRSWERVVAKIGTMFSGGVMLLILCVLPAGMSRSAWLAAGVSCFCVYAWHMDWTDKFRLLWQQQRLRVVMAVIGGLCVLLLAGHLLFALKPDSARGRLFMWKITCRAIAEKPLAGYGVNNFAVAYGDAQEAYFAAGDYEPWEERVAGSPEYAFNEYLQAAVELGIPLAACLLVAVILCLYIGVRKERYGICGAILSLMIFSFSSYPLQLPAFIVTFGGLLLACIFDGSRWQWLGLAVLVGVVGGFRLKNDLRTEQACREWMNARVLYNAGAYQSVEKEYERLYPSLRNRAAFLFEYGHGLHKQQKFNESNRVLEEALRRSCDPMILNVMGKNYQQMGDCLSAEDRFVRSTHRLPGRIYPYYLLAKLYAEPSFRQPDKFEKVKRMVLTKEPKVHSTAIRQMREEVKKIQIITPFK
ncbi:O-antigen ligase family protein [Bacteroides rodentium]|uniref:O-antigen ligase family protein n=1 Tax=Bacteroides rodentium TaxID=691816 RepID=UPI00046E9930|nr:O-antigen ligase family protein [Bacteroides rodentium]